MKHYVVKGDGEYRTYVEVMEKSSSGYTLLMKQQRRWGFKETTHRMSTNLFETCLRTGYFIEAETGEIARYA